MWWRAILAGLVVAGVSELGTRQPRVGALLLTLPIVSMVAFIMSWTKSHDMPAITQLARETLILVPLGLPFFIPLALSHRTGLSFWPSFALGVLLAGVTIGMWFKLSAQTSPDSGDALPPQATVFDFDQRDG